MNSVKTARKREAQASDKLSEAISDPNSGEFIKHKSEQDLKRARSGEDLFHKSLFEKVQFLPLEKSEAEKKSEMMNSSVNSESDVPPCLYVPSLNCNSNIDSPAPASTAGRGRRFEKTMEKGDMVPAESECVENSSH